MPALSRTDVILSAVLGLALIGLLAAFFTRPDFFDWAFARHQNTLSWALRPLLLAPMLLAAWSRRLWGILATLLALFTSMFWFPVPAQPDPQVIRFLAMERALLSSWSLSSALGLAAALVYLALVNAAFWRRSWRMGLSVVILGGLGKALWSLVFSPDGGRAVLGFALIGTGAVAALIWLALGRRG